MIQIYGKYTNALVYTVKSEEYAIEDYARAQLQMICNHPSAEGSKIRVMPDVHPGKVGTVGLTMTVGKSILPSLVGVDIGCGMTIAKLKTKGLEFQKLDTVIREKVPVGPKIRQDAHPFSERIHLEEMKCCKHIQAAKAIRSIGTLGGGNHFIELDRDEEGNVYLVIHSGSRHLGMEVADYYLHAGQKEMQMKKQGFASFEMTCLSGELMEDYLHDLKTMQEFAKVNREAMVDTIVKGMKWKIEDSFTCIHNYVDFSNPDCPILRKGAISAKEGEKVIIPINMRDGVILGTGRGNAEWNYSAPHGSGRVLRRSEVDSQHTVSEFKKEMKGIYSSCINQGTLDEAPFAYRTLEDISDVIGDTVTIDKIIKPVYNYKAGGGN